MGDFLDGLSNAFSSERLFYIKAEEEDDNLREFLPRVEYDPLTQALASTHLLKPKGKAHIDGVMKAMSASLLAVSVCLRQEEENLVPEGKQQLVGDKAKPTIIGVVIIGWGGIPADMAINRRASIGIMLAPEYRDKGYGREALNWMLDWAFRYAGLHTVALGVCPYNEGAIHLYKSLGFVQEGCLRESRYFNRRWHDQLLFAITEDEWERMRACANPGSN